MADIELEDSQPDSWSEDIDLEYVDSSDIETILYPLYMTRYCGNYTESRFLKSPFFSKLKSMLDGNDENGFERLLEHKELYNHHHLTHYCFSDKSLLEIACCEDKSNFVKILLDSGAQVNNINLNYYVDGAPIHLASKNGHHNVINELLKREELNIDLETVIHQRSTALYLAVKNKHIECVAILLNNGANPNIPDRAGITPLHLAVTHQYDNIVSEILKVREIKVDIDSYYHIYSTKKTTRELLLTNYPEIELSPKIERRINFYDLRFYIAIREEDSFNENIDKITEIDDLDKLIVFYASRYFLVDKLNASIDELLKKKKTMSDDRVPREALVAAVQSGNYEILQKFFESNPNNSKKIDDDLVLIAAEMCWDNKVDVDFTKKSLECFKIILNQPDINVRFETGFGFTPLHYVAASPVYDEELIQRLLQLGSCIGHHNFYGSTPIDLLSPISLSKHFDSCVRHVTNKLADIPEIRKMEFDYNCLIPLPISLDSVDYVTKTTRKCRRFNQLEMEMKPLKILSQKKRMKHLLHHPLLTSFITLKDYRIQKYVYANILFDTFFCFLMSCCIYFMACMNNKRFNGTINGTFNGTFEEKFLRNETRNGIIIGKFEGTTLAGFNGNISGFFDGTINEAINGTIYGLFSGTTDGTLSLSVVNLLTYSLMYAIVGVLTVIFLILLTIRELIELISIPVVYCRSIENGLEIMLIIISGSIISGTLAFSSFIFIFLAWKIINMLQQFQKFSVSIQMLKIVSFNFLCHLGFYLLFIFAFALAFFTLFQNENEDFESVISSLFKTIVMLTGEFDAGNIPFDKPRFYFGQIIFVLFIIFVVIILFNFFNGLAIFDTAKILKEAETIKLVSQVEQISYIEQLFASNYDYKSLEPFPLIPQWAKSLYYSFYPCVTDYSVEQIEEVEPKYRLNFLSFMKTQVFPDYVLRGKIKVKMMGANHWVKIKNKIRIILPLPLLLNDETIESANEILFKKNHISDGDKIMNEMVNHNQIVNNQIEEIKKNMENYSQILNRIEETNKNIKIELEGIYSKNNKKTRKTT